MNSMNSMSQTHEQSFKEIESVMVDQYMFKSFILNLSTAPASANSGGSIYVYVYSTMQPHINFLVTQPLNTSL